MNNIYQKAIDTFGEKSQKLMMIEEMAELTQAISKDFRGQDHNVEEEIADVEIMLEQMKLIYNTEDIKMCKEIKLRRLKGLTESNLDIERKYLYKYNGINGNI